MVYDRPFNKHFGETDLILRYPLGMRLLMVLKLLRFQRASLLPELGTSPKHETSQTITTLDLPEGNRRTQKGRDLSDKHLPEATRVLHPEINPSSPTDLIILMIETDHPRVDTRAEDLQTVIDLTITIIHGKIRLGLTPQSSLNLATKNARNF